MKSLKERFFEKVGPVTATGCREWLASCFYRKEYGQFKLEGKNRYAHRTAWFIEYGEWPEGVVMHACDNPRCVNTAHLSVGTHKDNTHDAMAKGRRVQQLTEVEVAAARQEYAESSATVGVIAERYGVNFGTVYDAILGKTWTHVGGGLPCTRKGQKRCKGEDKPDAKLTDDKVKAIRTDYAAGDVSLQELAGKYGVRKPAIWKVVTRRTWKHVA